MSKKDLPGLTPGPFKRVTRPAETERNIKIQFCALDLLHIQRGNLEAKIAKAEQALIDAAPFQPGDKILITLRPVGSRENRLLTAYINSVFIKQTDEGSAYGYTLNPALQKGGRGKDVIPWPVQSVAKTIKVVKI